jgi:hypothetical protein
MTTQPSSRTFQMALISLSLLSGSLSFLTASKETAPNNEPQKWASVKQQLRGTLRALRFALESYLGVERTFPATLQALIQSPYFPLSPGDIVNPYTGKFPDLISTAGLPSAAYPPGDLIMLSGFSPQVVLMTVFQDRSLQPSSPLVLEEVLTPETLSAIAEGRLIPLIPGDDWSTYAQMNFVDVRLYWRCAYLYQVIREKGFPNPELPPKKFKSDLEDWMNDREWFAAPLRKPTDGKPLSWHDPRAETPPEPGSFSVFLVDRQWVPQCYGLAGRPLSPALEALIQAANEPKQKNPNLPQGNRDKAKNKEGKGFRLP